MKTRIGALAIAMLLLAAIATGCASGGGAKAADLEGTWVVTAFGAPTGLTDAAPGVTTDLTFAAGDKASGNGGVNSYSTTYSAADGGDLTFGPVASTKMAGPDDAMAQETEFFSALEKTTRFEFNEGKLVLSDKGNNTLVVLTAK